MSSGEAVRVQTLDWERVHSREYVADTTLRESAAAKRAETQIRRDRTTEINALHSVRDRVSMGTEGRILKSAIGWAAVEEEVARGDREKDRERN